MNEIDPTLYPAIATALDRPIAFHRVFAQITGSVTTALFLSQAVYWTPRARSEDGFFYKTREEWTEETTLNRREQERSRECLIALGILQEERREMSRKLYYKIDLFKLDELVTSVHSRRTPYGRKCTNSTVVSVPSKTESTSETTLRNSSNASELGEDQDQKPPIAPNPLKQARLSWVARAMDIWGTRFGAISFGKIGRALKPVVDREGEESALAALSEYVKQTDPKYSPNPFKFAELYKCFMPKKPQGRKYGGGIEGDI